MNRYQFDFQRKRRRPAIKLSARGVYERNLNEEDVVKAIMQELTLKGLKVFRHKERIPAQEIRDGSGRIIGKQWRGSKSTPGIPDLFGWVPSSRTNRPGNIFPIPFFIEVKKPGKNHHRPAQIQFIEAARADTVIAFFAESWEDVLKGFAEFGINL